MAHHDTLPRVRVSGGPAERGRAYGEAARRQVNASREGYERAFARSGMPWREAVEYARRYGDAIASAFPEAISEMEGIAAGAGLPFDDVLAMNCRTEIMWDLAQRRSLSLRGECTSFGLAPEATENGHTWVGQNWDWLVHATDSIVVLEVERDNAPNYLTLVEAGLLGKATLNAAGIGIAVNTLITDRDRDTRGVPFHVVLRMLADIEHVSDAVELLAGVRRASSGNYLVGAAGGAVLDIECEPGGVAGVHPIAPVRGRIAHTNHFVAATRGVDLAPPGARGHLCAPPADARSPRRSPGALDRRRPSGPFGPHRRAQRDLLSPGPPFGSRVAVDHGGGARDGPRGPRPPPLSRVAVPGATGPVRAGRSSRRRGVTGAQGAAHTRALGGIHRGTELASACVSESSGHARTPLLTCPGADKVSRNGRPPALRVSGRRSGAP
ncbi:C45 family autoproteolytic acyltransferase/hydrolase [Microbacter sp. GSS18]|nr:C45 family autoproteolytic acyltransferase/hydrolase [Microbacter sp. GSS18]